MNDGAPSPVEFRCPACGGARTRPVLRSRDRLHGVAGEFQVVRCRDCGLMATHPPPTDLAPFYPPDYGPHADAAVGGFRSLAVLLPPLRPASRCVEIGSGAGAFVRHLRSLGHDAIGIDPAGGDVQGELADARLSGASVDALFAWQALEHVRDLGATLAECARVLRPGGWFAFSVPNAGCWEMSVFRADAYNLDLPRHLWHLRADDLRRLLASDFALVRLVGQRSLSTAVGSLGLRLGSPRLVGYPQRPRRLLQAALFPLACLTASIGQASRLTVLARRRNA